MVWAFSHISSLSKYLAYPEGLEETDGNDIRQVEVSVNVDNQLQRTLEFFLNLFWRYKQVAIVQGHFTNRCKPVRAPDFS